MAAVKGGCKGIVALEVDDTTAVTLHRNRNSETARPFAKSNTILIFQAANSDHVQNCGVIYPNKFGQEPQFEKC